MNTKQAYEKYGKWAVIAGHAAYLRSDGMRSNGEDSFATALAEHASWEKSSIDGDYIDDLPPYFARYSKSRPK